MGVDAEHDENSPGSGGNIRIEIGGKQSYIVSIVFLVEREKKKKEAVARKECWGIWGVVGGGGSRVQRYRLPNAMAGRLSHCGRNSDGGSKGNDQQTRT